MSAIYVGLTKEGVTVRPFPTKKKDTVHTCKNPAELEQAVIKICGTTEGVSMQMSSQLDWPRDVTDDPKLIKLCNLITGNSVD